MDCGKPVAQGQFLCASCASPNYQAKQQASVPLNPVASPPAQKKSSGLLVASIVIGGMLLAIVPTAYNAMKWRQSYEASSPAQSAPLWLPGNQGQGQSGDSQVQQEQDAARRASQDAERESDRRLQNSLLFTEIYGRFQGYEAGIMENKINGLDWSFYLEGMRLRIAEMRQLAPETIDPYDPVVGAWHFVRRAEKVYQDALRSR